jgi:misacylated tRNA(Ala) deacylase
MSKSYDPRMHSAEHILNQTMVRMFNSGRSFSAHIEKKKSKCDYHFNRNLTADEIASVEKKVNEIILADMRVSEEYYTREEAQNFISLEKLPGDAGDKIRIIKIGDYDTCPCRGEHIKSTAEIGGFKIISSDFIEGVLRVRFKLADNDGE